MTDNAQADDGWIEWNGGECPVDPKTFVTVRCRTGVEAGPMEAGWYSWLHYPDFDYIAKAGGDIIAYREVSQ